MTTSDRYELISLDYPMTYILVISYDEFEIKNLYLVEKC